MWAASMHWPERPPVTTHRHRTTTTTTSTKNISCFLILLLNILKFFINNQYLSKSGRSIGLESQKSFQHRYDIKAVDISSIARIFLWLCGAKVRPNLLIFTAWQNPMSLWGERAFRASQTKGKAKPDYIVNMTPFQWMNLVPRLQIMMTLSRPPENPPQ